MNYSQTVIANMALAKVGARGNITDVNEASPNAKKVLTVWDVIFAEVLAERDWKFAKTRVELQLIPQVPLYGYGYAYSLPSDFIRFVRPHKRPIDRAELFWWGWSPEGYGWYNRADPPFWPIGWPYIVESMLTGTTSDNTPSYTQCVLCDYPGNCGSARINYIQLITDYTKLQPGFVNALVNRLAAEIAVPITEDVNKATGLLQLYRDSLNSAEAQNETLDFQQDETGSESWLRAGRWGFRGR